MQYPIGSLWPARPIGENEVDMISLQDIQIIVSVGAVLIGIIYIVGGLIVNLHLANYGIVEYQIV
ncbi:MAG: hypothetical protein GTO63_30345 [Anaerolineae bacterium]|nr:hypothetical protein [Anaerolineae bacterium]